MATKEWMHKKQANKHSNIALIRISHETLEVATVDS